MTIKATNTVINQVCQITDATATTILAADSVNEQRVSAITVSTIDTADHDLTLYINDGSVDFQLGIVKIPLSSGNTNAIFPVDVIAALSTVFREKDNAGISFFNLKKGYSLKAKLSAVTSAKSYNVLVMGAKYDG